MSVSERLEELGIELPQVVPPVAAYVPAKVHGDLVYTAGQLPIVGGALPATGKVGDAEGLVAAADAQVYARQCALNAVAAAAAAAAKPMATSVNATTSGEIVRISVIMRGILP